MQPITLSVFTFEQPGGSFYYSKMAASLLRDSLYIRRRSSDDGGVQRDQNNKRIREIASYLNMADAILPTPLVISVTSAELNETCDRCELIIHVPENGQWGEIIDGQHRFEGLKEASNFSDYDIPICIFVDLNIEDKAEVFSTINSTQVRVPKSYIYDLFDYTDTNIPAKFCHDICKVLNYDENGPLYKKIKMLGKKANDSEVLSQAAVVDAILPLITKTKEADDRRVRAREPLLNDPSIVFRQLYNERNVVVLAKIITNFLNAVKNMSGDVWSNYVLRSLGIKVFMRVLGYLAPVAIGSGDFSETFLQDKLKPALSAILACTTREGTNRQSENKAVETIVSFLEIPQK